MNFKIKITRSKTDPGKWFTHFLVPYEFNPNLLDFPEEILQGFVEIFNESKKYRIDSIRYTDDQELVIYFSLSPNNYSTLYFLDYIDSRDSIFFRKAGNIENVLTTTLDLRPEYKLVILPSTLKECVLLFTPFVYPAFDPLSLAYFMYNKLDIGVTHNIFMFWIDNNKIDIDLLSLIPGF